MRYYTYDYIYGTCPKWDMDVHLKAKYKVPTENDDFSPATLLTVECVVDDPIGEHWRCDESNCSFLDKAPKIFSGS